eukprot:CAMPEP_0177650980 /NCGR_PEP_ID=MMETSP0447-20121125/12263_1 /TAXON_ID=0 /ORGANISM="Stygamoeba regulata, Strain BSH-02190019" /LENGTH=223 /DNA_ID=CAMNT_0019153949 /DNA_START=97 /DNA_END=768 /DNA_ORIENTATION=-
MVFCPECGVKGEGRFCGECGTALPAPVSVAPSSSAPPPTAVKSSWDGTGAPPNKDNLTSVTGGVRSYMAGATEAEKTEKKGQQKWGLFETNYQRKKGITTDESLREIDEFARGGVVVTHGVDSSSSSSAGGAGSGSGGFGSSGRAVGGGSSGGAGSGSGGFGSAGRTTGGSAAGATPSGGIGEFGRRAGAGTGQLPRGGNAGDAYFSQYQQKEKEKYKPGFRG